MNKLSLADRIMNKIMFNHPLGYGCAHPTPREKFETKYKFAVTNDPLADESAGPEILSEPPNWDTDEETRQYYANYGKI